MTGLGLGVRVSRKPSLCSLYATPHSLTQEYLATAQTDVQTTGLQWLIT